ncbi:MAG TPA: methyl-accepting chemotaxis protein [Planosporangium sp.]|jgi:methyl-accepting chemotaxis protein|nr:methyl-accepting chemotaxis protein [Planosporangium sp.]
MTRATRTRFVPLIRHKLLALGLGGVLLTAAALVGVGTWQSGNFASRTAEGIAELDRTDLQHVSEGMGRLVTAIGGDVQAAVDQNMTVANAELAQRGGLQLAATQVTWNAVNQVTQQAQAVSLPRAVVGGNWLGQNRDQNAPTPVVDDIRGMVGATVTVFQRMNDAGDLLRVATNVPTKTGERAIGTYIPILAADGKPNSVAATIRDGKPYRGVAIVVDTPYIAAYDPIRDASGRVIGALYVGVPQANAIKQFTDALATTKVGANGWVTVYSTLAADRGRVVGSTRKDLAGHNELTAADAGGRKYVEEIIGQAVRLDGGHSWSTGYRLAGAGGGGVAHTTVNVSYFAPYGWAIAVGGYGPDSAAALDAVNNGRRTMLMTFLVVAAVVSVIGLIFAVTWARRIGGRLARLTDALTHVADRDLTVKVADESGDEIGQMGRALNTAVGELRQLLGDITGASYEVVSAAGQVSTVGGQLADTASTASRQVDAASTVVDGVVRHVGTVAAGAEEMGASIKEIASNAHEAARVAEDSVGLASRAGEVIGKLGDSTAGIADMARVIHNIAEQTNLLALNATIEAARAGQAGRGFAIVANEVKELSQETARATNDVADRVAAIQQDSAGAIEAINAITAAIGRVNDFQAAIATAVEEQTATAGEMARNVGEAADGGGKIARSVSAVSEAVDSTGEVVRVSQVAAADLTATADRMTRLVGRFRL